MPIKRFNQFFLALVCVLWLASPTALSAQGLAFTDIRPKQNSPLSRFGLGDALDQHFAAQAGMGGLQTVFRDPYMVNLRNPASLASLQATSFELGIYAKTASIEDDNGAANNRSGNLSYLSLAFPLRNPININLDRQENTWNAGMAFSLAPATIVGYDLQLSENLPGVGDATNLLKGAGGTYRGTWSLAYRYKGLSVGLNTDLNFGTISNARILVFDTLRTALGTELLEEFSISGVSFGYGIQYAHYIKTTNKEGEQVNSNKRFLIGVNGKLGNTLSANTSVTLRRFSESTALNLNDVLSNTENPDAALRLPSEINVGFAYEEINKLFLGAEVGRGQWADYFNEGQPGDRLLNANRLAFGIQYIPDINSYNSTWKRMRYRFGLRIEDDPRAISGMQARKNALTFGLGMPILLPRQQVSFFNIAVEIGRFGVPQVIDETYAQLTLGFSLNDNSWFYKRKFN